MVRVKVAVLVLVGLPPLSLAAEERFEGAGYLLSCGGDGCIINAAGYDLFVAQDSGATLLAGLPVLAAIEVRGSLSAMGDATASLALEAVERRRDDPYEAKLAAMQGEWRSLGVGVPFTIGINGMEWTKILPGEVRDRSMISVGDACEDGSSHEGVVIGLYGYGDDPSVDACWLLEAVDDSRLTLRSLSPAGDIAEFARVPK